jgi:hypothetical protein
VIAPAAQSVGLYPPSSALDFEKGELVSDRNAPRPEPVMAPRKIWIAPAVIDLPRLENLTLQTGGTIPGDPSVYP